MNDLISRQEAIDAVENCEPGEELFMIKSLPSIDAVQVIRCKDCKHWTTMVERPKHGTCDQWCTLNVTRREEYCSRAERKE